MKKIFVLCMVTLVCGLLLSNNSFSQEENINIQFSEEIVDTETIKSETGSSIEFMSPEIDLLEESTIVMDKTPTAYTNTSTSEPVVQIESMVVDTESNKDLIDLAAESIIINITDTVIDTGEVKPYSNTATEDDISSVSFQKIPNETDTLAKPDFWESYDNVTNDAYQAEITMTTIDTGIIKPEPSEAQLAKTFSIYDAKTTMLTDNDRDGYYHKFKIKFDADVSSGSATVYVKLYLRKGSGNYYYIGKSSSFKIYGRASTDAKELTIRLTSPKLTGRYDVRMDLYQSGYSSVKATRGPSNDADLNDLKLEDINRDKADQPQTFRICRISTTLQKDVDNDGYHQEFKLYFDADVSSGSANVYAKIYCRKGSGSYFRMFTTETFTINGNSGSDLCIYTVRIPRGYPSDRYDLRIDLFKTGSSSVKASYGPGDDSDLNDLKLEDKTRDISKTFSICTASHALLKDVDSDGYHQRFSVTFDPDVNTGSASVYAKLYIRRGNNSFQSLYTTSSFTITGYRSSDARIVTMNLNHSYPTDKYDIRIDLYETGSGGTKATCGPGEDNDLNNLKLEDKTRDVVQQQSFSIYSVSKELLKDDDGDGYHQKFKVTFDADVSNGSANVYGKFYIRKGSNSYAYLKRSDVFLINERSSGDAQAVIFSLNTSFETAQYDIRIDLFKSGSSSVKISKGPDNFSALNNLKLEDASRDIAPTNDKIRLSWPFPGSSWSNKNGWHITNGAGGLSHAGGDYYAQDWNLSGSSDCGVAFKSPLSGTVIYAGWQSQFANEIGNQVVIQSNQDTTIAFRVAHLKTISVSKGQHVSPGTILGTIGQTGTGALYGCHAHCVAYARLNENYNGSPAINRLKYGYSLRFTGPKNKFAADFAFDKRTFFIYSAQTALLKDLDNDGYHQKLSIQFDADVSSGSANVYAKIYFRKQGGNYQHIKTLSNFTINDNSPNDAKKTILQLVNNVPTSKYDIRIELYETGSSGIKAIIGPENDIDLNDVKLEDQNRDVPAPQTFSIYNPITTLLQDLDGDGYHQKFQIVFDADVSEGSANVYARFYSQRGSGSYNFLYQTNTFAINGRASNDARRVTLQLNTNYPTDIYDIRIDLYQSGNGDVKCQCDPNDDPDLNNLKLEDKTRDVYQERQFSIVDATTSLKKDDDGDGYHQKYQLAFDANIDSGSASVYAKLYVRRGSNEYKLFYTVPQFTINGNSSSDKQIYNLSLNHNYPTDHYDIKIDLFASNQTSVKATRGPTNDPDLNNLPLEDKTNDIVSEQSIYIHNASVSLLQDDDNDGYHHKYQVIFDANVSEGTAEIYAKLYRRQGSSNYALYETTGNFSITSDSSQDAYRLNTTLNRNCPTDRYDIRIDLFKASEGAIQSSYGPDDDSDLNNIPLEDITKDTLVNQPDIHIAPTSLRFVTSQTQENTLSENKISGPNRGQMEVTDQMISMPVDITQTISVTTDELGDHIYLKDFLTGGSPGEPELPFYRFCFLLPSQVNWGSINVRLENIVWKDISGEYSIAPVLPPLSNTDQQALLNNSSLMNMSIYSSDIWFPSQSISSINPSKFRHWNLGRINFWPVSYNPVQKRIRLIKSANLVITFDLMDENQTTGTNTYVNDDRFWTQIDQEIENSQSRDTFYGRSETMSETLDDDDPNYIIVTTQNIQQSSDQFQAFIDNKQELGFRVRVITENEQADDSHYLSGDSTQSRVTNIRQWLRDRFANWGIEYVLLVGNPHPETFQANESVPMMMCYPRNNFDSHQSAPTDMCYAELSGNWDLDNDNHPGEFDDDFGVDGGIDRDCEVSVGRIPYYGNMNDLNSIFSKTIDYANAAGDQSWRKKLLIPTAISNFSPEDRNHDGDANDPNDSNGVRSRTFGVNWTNQLQTLAENQQFDVFTLLEKEGIYDDGSAYPLDDCDADLNRDNLEDEWQNHYGFVTWWGHGSYSRVYRRVWESDNFDPPGAPGPFDRITQQFRETDDTYFWGNTDCDELDNDHPSFVIQVSCNNGWPEHSTNLGYSLLKNGAIATISSTRVSWYKIGTWGTTDGNVFGDNASYAYHMVDRMITHNETVGVALNHCKRNFGMRFNEASWMNCLDFNVYGDPSATHNSQTRSETQKFIIYNEGESNLNISSIEKQNNKNWLDFTPKGPLTISPGQKQDVSVSVKWNDVHENSDNERIIVRSNVPGKNPYPDAVNIEVEKTNTSPALHADFSAYPRTSTTESLRVHFTDLSEGYPTSWQWNFGDGSTSNEQHPEHMYLNSGTYSVQLTISNNNGSDTETKTNYIVIHYPTIRWATSEQAVFESNNSVRVPVVLNQASDKNVEVSYTVFGTASLNSDHNLANGSLTIPSGQTEQTLLLNIINDTQNEPEETIIINLHSPVNAALGDIQSHTIRIRDDDDPLPEYQLSVFHAGSGTGSVRSTPAGIVCGSICQEYFQKDSIVTLTATPGADARFIGWSGACNGLNDCYLDIQSNTQVTATFERVNNQPAVRIEPLGLVFYDTQTNATASQRNKRMAKRSENSIDVLQNRTIYLQRGTIQPDEIYNTLETNEIFSGNHSHVLIQFDHILSQQEQNELASSGINILRYVPDSSYWVSITPDQSRKRTRTQSTTITDSIQWAWKPTPKYKISEAVEQNNFPENTIYADNSVRIRVLIFKDVAKTNFTEIIQNINPQIQVIKWIAGHLVELRLMPDLIETIAALDAVEWIEPAPPPVMTYNQTAAERMHLDTLRIPPSSLSGNGLHIGVWDGGAVYQHSDFGDRLIIEDRVNVREHATHVAGTIGGSGMGNPLALGMAPEVIIHSFDWQDDEIEMQEAVQNNIVISNHSYGFTVGWYLNLYDVWVHMDDTGFGQYSTHAQQWDEIVYNTNLIVFKAAGNDRDDGPGCPDDENCDGPYGCISHQGISKNLISIGATTDSDEMTYFSSWGPADDGRIKPDLCANGYQLLSTMPDNQYENKSGTSMATPAASGAAALLYQHFQNTINRAPSPAMLKALLIHSARDLGRPGPDYSYGWGLINAEDCEDLIMNRHFATSTIVQTGDVQTFSVNVGSGSESLKVTLVWTDPPGSPAAAKALVNDLDLALLDANSHLHYPWRLDPDNPENNATKGPNHVDNVEQVIVDNPESGIWTIRVSGFAVPSNGQDFVIVAESMQNQSKSFHIYNDGDADLIVNAISSENDSSWLNFQPVAPLTISPGQSRDIAVNINWNEINAGSNMDRLIIETNDSDKSPYPGAVNITAIKTETTSEPSANFRASVTYSQSSPLTVTFTDLSSGEPDEWHWNFGDNTTSTQQNPVHTYTEPGMYTVMLTVVNAYGTNSLIKKAFIVVDYPKVTWVLPNQNLYEDAGEVSIGIELSDASPQHITIPYRISGTAKYGSDHNLSNGLISLPSGLTSNELSFRIIDDTLDEPLENIMLIMENPIHAIYGRFTIHTITVIDNDEPAEYILTITKSGIGSGLITSNPASISCGDNCSAIFTDGSLITLIAEADNGSVFNSWQGGGCSGNGNCTVTMNQSHSITADFEIASNQPNIMVEPLSLKITQPMPTNGATRGILYRSIVSEKRTDIENLQVLECDITDLEILSGQNDDGYDILQLSGDEFELMASEPGDPMLPGKTVYILIPPGAQICNVEINILDKVVLDQSYEIFPKQPEVPLSSNVVLPIQPLRENLVSSEKPFPERPVTYVETATLRGNSMAVFKINPIQYIPKTGKVIVNKRFRWSFHISTNVYQTLQYQQRSPVMEQLLKQKVVNSEIIDSIVPQSLKTNDQNPAGHCDYLIITSELLKTAFQTLADHKSNMGMDAEIVTTEYIFDHYNGKDSQEKIKQCIIDYATNKGTLWLLLGGDDSVIPDRNCYLKVFDEIDYTIPTDLYYAGLDDLDWNDDNDLKWCEPEYAGDTVDLYPDVFIGRAPVQTVNEAEIFVEKTIRYVNEPPSSDFAERSLFAGNELWNSWDGKSDAHHRSEDMWHTMISPYWTGEHFRLYDTGTDFPSNEETVNPQNLLNLVSDGFGLVFVATHGNQTFWDLQNQTHFTTSNALECGNQYKQGILYTIACNTNAFDREKYASDPCLSEAFLRNPNGGMVAYIGSSRFGWGSRSKSIHAGTSFKYAQQFFRQLFDQDTMSEGNGDDPDPKNYPGRIGSLHASHKMFYAPNSRTKNTSRWLQFSLNLMGDPHINIHTENPKHQFTIFNNGHADLEISSLIQRDNDLWLSYTPESYTAILAGESRPVSLAVDWSQVDDGNLTEKIIIYSNVPGKSPFQSGVFVEAVKACPEPIANFSASTRSADISVPVTFSDLSLWQPDTWHWSFGDGNTSNSQHPLHTYTAPGNYSISLTVSNSCGTNAMVRKNYITAAYPVVQWTIDTQNLVETVKTGRVTAIIDKPTPLPITISCQLEGTASGGGIDYSFASLEFVIPSGQQSQDIFFEIQDDRLEENDESIIIKMDVAQNATIGELFSHTVILTDPIKHQLNITLTGNGAGAVISDPAGISCALECSSSFYDGSLVNLIPIPEAGSEFYGWSGAECNTSVSCSVAMYTNMSLTACFHEIVVYQLDIDKSGNGSVQVNNILENLPFSQSFPADTYISLTAEPDEYWNFSYWLGNIMDTSTTTGFHINQNMSITARFDPITFTLSVSRMGVGNILLNSVIATLPTEQAYPVNSTIELLATPEDSFSHWSGSVTDAQNVSNPIIISMNENKNLTAHFDNHFWETSIHAKTKENGGQYRSDVLIGLSSGIKKHLAPPPAPGVSCYLVLVDINENLIASSENHIENWEISNLTEDIRKIKTEKEYMWILSVNQGIDSIVAETNGYTLEWNPSEFHPEGFYQLREGFNGNGKIIIPDMRTKTKYFVSDGKPKYFTLHWTWKDTLSFDLELKAGWNLISVPLIIIDDPFEISTYEDVSDSYLYQSGRYKKTKYFEPGSGYWVFSTKDQVVTLSGIPFYGYTKTFGPGWHLIGGLFVAELPILSISELIDIAYQYDNGRYIKPETLNPGIGYWIYVGEEGEISLSVE
ncbi:secreted protein containing Peptidase S8 and S53, subtilisin, kexin, sedolisin [Candidatus Magnetomorum sp. HK-1]|nr:secreted protein containing Peptidase S8 and S53, subtilisin, kexin, sedolisin [Candidatus Magnetomorum sp. HK-1]